MECALAFESLYQNQNCRNTEVLRIATVEIVEKYHAPRAISVNIFAATANKENTLEVNGTISYVLNKIRGSLSYQLHVIPQRVLKKYRIENKDAYSLLFVDGYESFR